MQKFEYVITDEVGMHARPAGLLVKEVGKHASKVQISLGEKVADGNKLFALMQLGIKKNDTITVSAEGSDEENVIAVLKQFFENNL